MLLLVDILTLWPSGKRCHATFNGSNLDEKSVTGSSEGSLLQTVHFWMKYPLTSFTFHSIVCSNLNTFFISDGRTNWFKIRANISTSKHTNINEMLTHRRVDPLIQPKRFSSPVDPPSLCWLWILYCVFIGSDHGEDDSRITMCVFISLRKHMLTQLKHPNKFNC